MVEPVSECACYERTRCRVCLSEGLERFLDLGTTALANRFIDPERVGEPEPKFPLQVDLCHGCGQVQLGHVVSPALLFRDYIYVSSTSETMRRHFAAYASEMRSRLGPRPGALVVEVASNDGCLLRAFQGSDLRLLGVEPATNIAALANAEGVPTINEFFSEALARRVRHEHGPAAALMANNVLAHVDDLDDFLRGVDALLAPDGVVVIEVPHLLTLLRGCEFDTIYHEHLSYFSLAVLVRLFGRFGLHVQDVERVAVHGGSLRVYAGRSPATGGAERVEAILAEERAHGLADPATYRSFAEATERLRDRLLDLLRSFARSGARLAGYGAPAKGNTLLQYCEIGADLLEFVVDRSPFKQGKLTPGTHIPVYAPERLLEAAPGMVLLLAWNFADEVLQQQAEYRARGGRFVVPIPTPTVV